MTTASISRESNLWEAWRAAFSQVIESTPLGASLKDAALSGRLGQWTGELTSVVVRACDSLGWDAAARWNPSARLPVGRKEYLAIDVVALPRSPDNRPQWPFLLAAFELENSRREAQVAYSLWKVLNLRVPLRVVFAYRPDWQQGSELVANLAAIVVPMPPDERMSVGGETIVVVGNRGEGATFPWGYFKAWRLDMNRGTFDKI